MLDLSFISLTTLGFLDGQDSFDESLDIRSLSASASDELNYDSSAIGAFCDFLFRLPCSSPSPNVEQAPWLSMLYRLGPLLRLCRRSSSEYVSDGVRVEGVITPASTFEIANGEDK